MLRIYPPDTRSIDPLTLYDDLALLPPKPDRPSIALNMVTTIDGKVAIGGRAAVIGSAVDHLAMRKIRAAADCVLNGAGTLRAEGVNPTVPASLAERRVRHGLPAQPIAAVLSLTGDVPLDRPFFRIPELRRIVITSHAIPASQRQEIERVATVLAIGDPDVDLPAALQVLREQYGVERLVAEGGPRLNGILFQVDCVDEIFWTLAPKIASGNSPTMVVGPERSAVDLWQAAVVTVFKHEDELFLRYRLRRDEGMAGPHQ